jgi:hypothetical protein
LKKAAVEQSRLSLSRERLRLRSERLFLLGGSLKYRDTHYGCL